MIEKSLPDVCAILSELHFEIVVVDTECSLPVLCVVKSETINSTRKQLLILLHLSNSVDS